MKPNESLFEFGGELCRLIQQENWRSPDQRPFTDQEFNRLALRLYHLQFIHNQAYQIFCRARGISPDQIDSWPDIPTMPTCGFREFDMTSLPPEDRPHVFFSSGTTGQKTSRHFHNASSLLLYEASVGPPFRDHVAGGTIAKLDPAVSTRPETRALPGLLMILLTPGPAQAPHSSLVHMLATVGRTFGSSDSCFVGTVDDSGAWGLDFDKTGQALVTAERAGQPVLVLGTAFGFVHLADHLQRNKVVVRLPASSRVMETGGYKGRSRPLPRHQLHDMMANSLGMEPFNIVCEYGMCELSSQAYDRVAGALSQSAEGAKADQRVFRFPPWARTQIVSPETGREVVEGQTGLIQVFDLANVWSVMAIQTEDLGIRRGVGFEWAGRVQPAEPRGCSLMQTDLETAHG